MFLIIHVHTYSDYYHGRTIPSTSEYKYHCTPMHGGDTGTLWWPSFPHHAASQGVLLQHRIVMALFTSTV